ncbi:hypothetical protein LW139_18010 [Proteus vulgaris]|uniref:hypothetical protein n=1 Tax=Proteus TaxID=583 RepID=UPI0014128A7E|nr:MULTISPECIES: hypothetical protein [Proteus]NBM56366.1 hypothetical protein [Proteus sp. G2669]UPK80659.1 hypothetical protein LW139_18010 [Proteus vulgaris]
MCKEMQIEFMKELQQLYVDLIASHATLYQPTRVQISRQTILFENLGKITSWLDKAFKL